MTCLVAKQGSPLLEQIKSAAQRKDYSALRRYRNTIARELAAVSRGRENLSESLNDMPVLTEFRYGTQILAQRMFTTEMLEVATASVFYGGGSLDHDDFQAVDHFHPAIIPDTEHVVVVSMPSLTVLEQAILSRVPEEHSELFVSVPGFIARAAAVPDEAAISANVADRPVDEARVEEIDGPDAEDVEAQDEIGSGDLDAALAALQQQDFSGLDETASSDTLLNIRMQLRRRR
ncbi:MAG TPA: hypothetical protein VFH11_01670 [Gemmatimonadota bacterium]|nr:hypothetical protein [Gemmatimonadota bacterium]